MLLIIGIGTLAVAAFWYFAWLYPDWGLAAFGAMVLLLWLLTRDRSGGAPTGGEVAAEAVPDHVVAWADLPAAVRERLGGEDRPGHEVWACERPDASGAVRTEWRMTNARGDLVEAFWL
jgi:hypothetical protein